MVSSFLHLLWVELFGSELMQFLHQFLEFCWCFRSPSMHFACISCLNFHISARNLVMLEGFPDNTWSDNHLSLQFTQRPKNWSPSIILAAWKKKRKSGGYFSLHLTCLSLYNLGSTRSHQHPNQNFARVACSCGFNDQSLTKLRVPHCKWLQGQGNIPLVEHGFSRCPLLGIIVMNVNHAATQLMWLELKIGDHLGCIKPGT